MMNFKVLATTTAVAMAPGLASAAVLDDFDDFQRAQVAPSATYDSTSVIGNRTFDVQASGDPDEADVVLTTRTGVLQFSNQFGAAGTGTVAYDFAGLDLSSGAAFTFDFLSTDNPFDLLLSVSDSDSSSSVMRSLTAADNGTTQSFAFGGFDNIDFSDISQISLVFDSNGSTRVDTAIDNLDVAPIPVPAAGLLLLGGLAALGAVKRRKV